MLSSDFSYPAALSHCALPSPVPDSVVMRFGALYLVTATYVPSGQNSVGFEYTKKAKNGNGRLGDMFSVDSVISVQNPKLASSESESWFHGQTTIEAQQSIWLTVKLYY